MPILKNIEIAKLIEEVSLKKSNLFLVFETILILLLIGLKSSKMPTTIKAALKRWEEASGKKAGEAKEIKLIGVYPPIEKMDGPFHLLINCEKFSLSTNMITNIQV